MYMYIYATRQDTRQQNIDRIDIQTECKNKKFTNLCFQLARDCFWILIILRAGKK